MNKNDLIQWLRDIESDVRSALMELREGNYESAEDVICRIKDMAEDLPRRVEF